MPSLKKYLPLVLSYHKFITLKKTCLFSLFIYSQACLKECTGI
ncbi:hypothetical protein NEOC95_001716 [Neochlamydia sp. AcF95]|nr:hypothetical protein [Neochlamydia sp. AcF95]